VNTEKFIYYVNCFLIIVFVFLADFISKKAIVSPDDVMVNSGLAFSLFKDNTLLVTIVSCIIILLVLIALVRIKNYFYAIPLCFIVGGGLGNVNERFINWPYYGRGAVTDFINYFGLFTGNVADIFIVLGGLGLVLNYIYVASHKGLKNKSTD
jgi:lipoprotein signal peptidase